MEDALHNYLIAHAGLNALIEGRFAFDTADQDWSTENPYVVAINVSDVKDHTLEGQLSIERPIYQFTAYGTTRSSARAIAEQIKAALSDFSGNMGGINVQYIQLQNEIRSTQTENNIKTHIVDLEFQINYDKE